MSDFPTIAIVIAVVFLLLNFKLLKRPLKKKPVQEDCLTHPTSSNQTP